MKTGTPKEVIAAVKAFARAVKLTGDILGRAAPDPISLYHAREYLVEMEDLLVQQLVTDFPDVQAGLDLLASCGLDYLQGRLTALAEQWGEDE